MDTLKYYKELIATGSTDAEAQAHVYALHGALDTLVTKDYLHGELRYFKVVGSIMFLVVIAPALTRFLQFINSAQIGIK